MHHSIVHHWEHGMSRNYNGPFHLMVNHDRFMAHFGARKAFLQGIEGRLSRTYLWKWMSSPFFLHVSTFSTCFTIFSTFSIIFFPSFSTAVPPSFHCSYCSRSKPFEGHAGFLVGNQRVMCLLLNFNHYILERSSDTPIAYNIL